MKILLLMQVECPDPSSPAADPLEIHPSVASRVDVVDEVVCPSQALGEDYLLALTAIARGCDLEGC